MLGETVASGVSCPVIILKKGVVNFIRDLIIGRNRFIDSYGEYKQVMLSGQYALISIALCVVYGAMDLFNRVYSTLPVFIVSILLLIWSIKLHRSGKHCQANYFLLPTINIMVYLFAASESPQTGIFIFFISTSISAFAIFSYKQRLVSILFTVFTYVLFVFAYFVDFSILPKRNYSDEMLLFNIVVNFTAALPVSTMAIYLMISLNHYNSVQLLANNKMLSKTNAELDRFVYSTSHDLRAPLASVLGLIDITKRSTDRQEVNRYLEMMTGRIYALDKFVRDITDYSQNNRLAVKRDRIALKELAQEVWESLRYAPEAANINFFIDVPADMEIVSDRKRLSIVLNNLMSNAIRYHDTRKGDKFIRLQYHANGKGFFIEVKDNGIGIPAEYHGKIFEMFFRANEKSPGSGLGLYIVRETLAKLSASIQLESAPGKGSSFILKFPY